MEKLKTDSIEMEFMLDVLAQTGTVKLPVQGNSMSPFLKNKRDKVILSLPKKPLKKGDIAVFRRGKAFVMHRIIGFDQRGIVMLGDNEFNSEHGIKESDVAAVVTAAERNGKIITPSSPVWLFFSKVYINPAARKAITGAYGLIKKGKSDEN